jgi:hypothetical protein
MKKVLIIALVLLSSRLLAQPATPTVPPSPYTSMTANWYKYNNYITWEKLSIMGLIDTTDKPYRAGGFGAWMSGDTAKLMFYDGGKWKDVSGGGFDPASATLYVVSHNGNHTDTTITSRYYNASYNPIDTSSIRKSTTIKFVGDFASVSLVGYAQALQFYSGNQVVPFGISGETSPQILSRFVTNTTATPSYLTAYANIWEAGRNNLGNLTQMKADATAFADAMTGSGNTKWAILSVYNGSGENPSAVGVSKANYDTVIAFNAWAAATYTTHFLDARTNAVNRYNPQLAQDVIDFANNTPPLSLRQDFLHPNKYGYDWIAYDLDTMAILSGASKYVCWGNSFTQGSYYPYPAGYSVSISNKQRLYSSADMLSSYVSASWNYGGLTVINIGRPADYYDTATVHRNVDSIVSYIGNDKYVIFGEILADTVTDILGGSRHNAVLGLNTTLATQYGDHFYNTLNLLLSHYNPSNPKDVIDHANGVVPSSLKIDSALLNTTGQAYIMTQVVTMLSTLEGSSNTALTTANIPDILSSPPVIGASTPNYIVASKMSIGGNSAYAYPLNIQSTDQGHIGINGTGMVYLPNQTQFSGSSFFGNGGLNLSTGAIQNTGLGIYTLSNNTTGYKNTAVGFQALASTTTGLQNTAVGNTAGFNNITGYDNTLIGNQTAYYNTTGIMLTYVGSGAGLSNTTGYQNTGIGYRSLFLNSTGLLNTGTGFASLLNSTTGSGNAAFGAQALDSNGTGSFNTAVGYLAAYTATTNNSVTAIGGSALQNNKADNNTAVGYSAGVNNTTGAFNTFVGYRADNYATTGQFKTYMGYQSGYFDSSNNYGTAFGYATNKYNTADYTTAFGYLALGLNTTGSSNTGIGANALHSNTTGGFNTATGFNALYNHTTGNYNTATGYRALFNDTAGAQNTATGVEALFTNITGVDNTATGFRALYLNDAGSDNTATGRQALYNNTGTNNTANGWLALIAHKTGNNNVAVGGQSLVLDTTGAQNTAVGASAGQTGVSGSSNILIGYNAANGLKSGSQNTWIGANSSATPDSTNSNRIGLLDGNNHMGFYGNALAGNFAIGSTTTDASAILNLPSTTKGFLPPSMTTTQKNAISSPTAGLTVYDNVLGQLYTYNGSSWVAGGGGGTTANAVTFNNGGAGDASGTTFNGGTARTISYNTLAAAGTAASNIFTGSNSFRGGFNTAGSISAAAWGTNGANFNINASTITDNSTAGSSTVGSNFVNTIGVPTLAATNTSITYTNAATLYISGPPTAGTNVTLTNPYALQIQSGNVRLSTVTSGTWNGTAIGLAYGGTASNLSATGGAGKFLKQASSGAAITVVQPAAADLSDGTTGSGTVVLNTAPTLTGNTTITNGNLTLGTAGNKLVITEGTDGRVGQTTLVSGTKAITITGLTTSSRAIVTLVTPSGTTLTVLYQAVCTANTLTIQANVAAGTINTADGSTLNYFVLN